MHRAWVVTRREIRDSLTDWRILTPMLTLAILFPLVAVFGIRFGLPYLSALDPHAAADKVVPFGTLMASFFPISFSLILALESFVGEKERNTLEALLATPISDAELFVGKLVAVLAPPVALSLTGLLVYLAGLAVFVGLAVTPGFVGLAILLALAEALVMVAAAVVVSSHTTSVRAANLLASFIILPMAVVVQAETLALLFGTGQLLGFFLAALVVIAVILIRTGIRVFHREQILAREADGLNLPAVGRMLVGFWRATPRAAYARQVAVATPWTPLRFVRVDLPELIALHRGPLAVVGSALAVGLVGGFVAGARDPAWAAVRLEGPPWPAETWEAVRQLSTGGIFLHNLQAIILGATLSLVSFGAALLVTLILSLAVVGYVVGAASQLGFSPLGLLAGFVLPHGVFELPAAALAGAVSLRLGMAVMAPPPGFSIGEALALALVNWAKLALVFVPLFLLAAFVEANLTPRVAQALFGG